MSLVDVKAAIQDRVLEGIILRKTGENKLLKSVIFKII